MPMLELAAGGEDEWILGVRRLVGRRQFGRDELAEAAGAREAFVEHDVVAGLIGGIRRIGYCAFARDALPRDVVERRHQRRHLSVDVTRMLVVPRQTDA